MAHLRVERTLERASRSKKRRGRGAIFQFPEGVWVSLRCGGWRWRLGPPPIRQDPLQCHFPLLNPFARADGRRESLAPMLIAPMGASVVLLFAAPSSPLAQLLSILAGNCIAAAIGVTIAGLVGDPILAAALALSLAIGAMLATQSLHPPSGAVAESPKQPQSIGDASLCPGL
ncbi:hypothetical protein EMQ25_14025 [Arsenicitalea aurantiaca]|uniref:HPP transmembrane region domain-containing protein n=1 Tax=Arsenicitalea aurantiaca TaxID=1783274 RepID=A0A433X5A4_9HYPH|nr:hypothetical protein EMQ25_14025 [Arsenicitalea aurantiaca]